MQLFHLIGAALAVSIETTITLAPLVVVLLVGTFIPILVGIVTKLDASPALKQVLTIVLSGIAGLLNTAVVADGSAVFSVETLLLAGATWLTAIATYAGVYGSARTNDHLAPKFGIGGAIDTTAVEKIQ